jgi:hypothetical protein
MRVRGYPARPRGRKKEETTMDRVCFALPILPGQTSEARAFQQELDGPRKAAYAESERRIGITREYWFLQETPGGDLLLAYMESPDFAAAVARFSASRDPFDVWFKQRLAGITGVDLNTPPPGPLSELLSTYEADPQLAGA